MMLITLATTVFDLDGYIDIVAPEDTTDGETRRRVNRTGTLDGGVSVVDGGYVDGDRTLEYTWKTESRAHNDAIDRLVRLYTRINASTPDGVYLVAPDTFKPGADESYLKLLVIEKIV